MTINRIKSDLAELKEAIKSKVSNVADLRHDKTGKVVKFNGVDVTGCTQEEIDEKLKNFSVVLNLPVKDPYPGGTCDYSAN